MAHDLIVHLTPSVMQLLHDANIHVVALAPYSSENCQPIAFIRQTLFKQAVSTASSTKLATVKRPRKRVLKLESG